MGQLEKLPLEIDVLKMGVFIIRMEGSGGLIGKHPDYIKEKYNSVLSMDEPWRLLDSHNKRKYVEWLIRFRNSLGEGVDKLIMDITEHSADEVRNILTALGNL